MGSIIGLLVGKTIFGKTITEKAARAIAYAGLFLLIAALIYGVVAWIRSDAVSDHQQKIEHRAAPATSKAADERAADAITNAKQEQEMHDVIAKAPDQPIAPTSRARACEQLRRAGRHPAACG